MPEGEVKKCFIMSFRYYYSAMSIKLIMFCNNKFAATGNVPLFAQLLSCAHDHVYFALFVDVSWMPFADPIWHNFMKW